MSDQTLSPDEMVDQVAALIDLPLDPEYRPGVINNFRRTAAIAKLVVEFPLPADLEAAPVFQP